MRPESAASASQPIPAPRLNQLLDFFEMVLQERMADVPVINASLCIEAVGFRYESFLAPASFDNQEDLLEGYDGPIIEGVLITPWFMSLIRLPVALLAGQDQTGKRYLRRFGNEAFDFLGNYDSTVGYFESCALFSPMAEFDSQQLARETAQHVLTSLRPNNVVRLTRAGRRSFLTGRSPATGTTT